MKILVMIIVSIINICSITGSNNFWLKEDNKKCIPITQYGNGILFRKEYSDNTYEFAYVDKKDGSSLWKDNMLMKSHISTYVDSLAFDHYLYLYNLDSKKYCCYDFINGDLIWSIDMKDLYQYNNGLICEKMIYYYNTAITDDIKVISIDTEKKGANKEITLNTPYKRSLDKKWDYFSLIHIDEKRAVFVFNNYVQCYSFIDKKYIWKLFYNTFYNGYKYVYGDHFIYSTANKTESDKSFPDIEDYDIIGINLVSGNEDFSFDGSPQFYVENNVIYYFSYELWNKETKYTKCIGAYSIDNKKDVYKYGSKTMYFRLNGFLNYDTGLVQLQDTPRQGKNDKINIFDKYLKPHDSLESPFDLGSYYITKDCLIGLREWRMGNEMQGYTIWCYNLPTYKVPDPPKKENPKIPFDLIGTIVRFILGRLMGTP